MPHNPFAKPLTPEEWLLSSVCWTFLCIAGWAVLTWPFLLASLPYEYRTYEPTLLFLGFIGPYTLAWIKATPPKLAFESRFVLVEVCVALWTVTLFIVLMGWLLIALFLMALSGPSTGFGF
ncbi:hypothetical protein [Hymenobacter armeniacus]|uniref:Transmembrane protein n=1 Tax=Hymenobacter armeniacus TaxID=2771358 RepID=A0ABR8JZC6_9BACT|nr:hypothetical protein [Hymenobacter armeniacus]MBD2724246.1 hypothetical protein [Hymenobacter armeniacus]